MRIKVKKGWEVRRRKVKKEGRGWGGLVMGRDGNSLSDNIPGVEAAVKGLM